MSKAKRLLKAQKRRAEYEKHAAPRSRPCLNCGQPGPHFVPPGLGSPGAYICTTTEPTA